MSEFTSLFNENFENETLKEKLKFIELDNKAPVNKNPYENALSFNEANANFKAGAWREIGAVVAKPFIVLDFDLEIEASLVYEILEELDICANLMQTEHGAHLWFTSKNEFNNVTGAYTPLSMRVDVRSWSEEKIAKGHVRIGKNGKYFKWKKLGKIGKLPWQFKPFKDVKKSSFAELKDHDGRNQALFDWKTRLILQKLSDEKINEALTIINSHIFAEPLEGSSFETLLRENSHSDLVDSLSQADAFKNHTLLAEHIFNLHAPYREANGGVYLYNGRIHTSEECVFRQIVKKYKKSSNNSFRTETLIDIDTCCIDRLAPRPNPGYIMTENGRLNLKTCELEEPTPDVFIVNEIPVKFDPTAKCPTVSSFLEAITISNQDLQNLIWEMIGTCIMPQYVLKTAFFLLGRKNNGKSTLVRMLTDFLGPKNCTALTLTDLEHGFKPADLKNKLLSICGDVGSKKIINLELFKMLTGGDENMYDVKNKTPIRFTNYATLIFGANKMPQPIERCEAFYDRVMIVPLPRFFPKQPPELEDKLRRDLSSENAKSFILNKALEGLRRLHKNNGFTLPDMSKNVKREYMEEDDYVLEFLHENDISGLSSTEAYKKFEQWRYDKNYPCFMTEREFNKDVKNKGWELHKNSVRNGEKINSTRTWKNINKP